MKRVGILVGREQSFPESIINSINAHGNGEIVAEMVKIGGIRMDDEKKYDLVIDRISHEVPYYRAALKQMALAGTYIVNNPFWWSADDKFFNFSLANKLGVAIPKTVLLPQEKYIKDITSESLRNLEFPVDWQGIVEHVGFPAFLKPHDGGGWKNVSKIWSLEQLWHEYNQSGTLCMTLQEGIEYDQFVRCYCVGQEKVLIMPYDPSQPYLSGMQYVNVDEYLTPELHARVEKDVITICKALGYDLNTVEFAIKDGIPYAIDFMNPAPDAERASVGEKNHNWIVEAMTEFVIKKLSGEPAQPEYNWSGMLSRKEAAPKASASKTETLKPAAKTAKPKVAKTTEKAATEKKPRSKKSAE